MKNPFKTNLFARVLVHTLYDFDFRIEIDRRGPQVSFRFVQIFSIGKH